MIPAPVLNLGAAMPLLLIAAGAFLVLAFDLFLPRATDSERWRKSLALSFASLGVLAAVIASSAGAFGAGSTLEFSPDHPMFQLDRLTAFGQADHLLENAAVRVSKEIVRVEDRKSVV